MIQEIICARNHRSDRNNCGRARCDQRGLQSMRGWIGQTALAVHGLHDHADHVKGRNQAGARVAKKEANPLAGVGVQGVLEQQSTGLPLKTTRLGRSSSAS